jgi:hypothetical protein
MSLLHRKGTLEKASESDFGQILKTAARSTLASALGPESGNGVLAGSGSPAVSDTTKPLGWAAKPVLAVAGGVAGMTAASAVVSAVRRKQDEA